MRTRSVFLCVLLVCSATLAFCQEDYFYWPTCGSPQNIAPMQNIGGVKVEVLSSIAWNGKDYAVAWIDMSDAFLHFRRFFADGTPAGPDVIISTRPAYYHNAPRLVWNGAGYAVAWGAYGTSFYQVYFMLLDADGNPVSGEVKVSFVSISEQAHALHPSLAYSGSGYCVAWDDDRANSGVADIYTTLLDSSGVITFSDLAVSIAANDQFVPSVAWSTAHGCYLAVWEDMQGGAIYEIYGSMIIPEIGGVTSNNLVYSGVSSSYYPVLASMGSGYGVAWYSWVDTSWEVYFARLDGYGAMFGSATRVTNNTSTSSFPALVWTGAEFGVFWHDIASGIGEIWFQRIGASGTLLGNNMQVTNSGGMYSADAAFGKYGYLVTGTMTYYANYVSAWGCAADTTPPSCPGGFVAYNITGNSAILGWLPSGETETDIAYYIVYRDALPIAYTSDTHYHDSGLGLSTTYAYSVQPVNAAQLQNYSCQTTYYLKTNATLLLMVEKNEPNARLTWNDEGMSSYNVFRGTSPQTMSLIGNTSELSHEDPNVLLDRVNYFYTVDDPGQ